MRPVGLATVLVRAFALWQLVEGVQAVTAVFQRWAGGRILRHPEVLVIALRVLLPIATAGVVWVWAEWLAKRVAAGLDDEPREASWRPAELLRIAVAIIGLATVVQSLPELAWFASVFVAVNWWRNSLLGPVAAPSDIAREYWGFTAKANCAGTIIRAAVGLLLVVKPGSVAFYVGRGDRGRKRAEEPAGAAQQGDEADED